MGRRGEGRSHRGLGGHPDYLWLLSCGRGVWSGRTSSSGSQQPAENQIGGTPAPHCDRVGSPSWGRSHPSGLGLPCARRYAGTRARLDVGLECVSAASVGKARAVGLLAWRGCCVARRVFGGASAGVGQWWACITRLLRFVQMTSGCLLSRGFCCVSSHWGGGAGAAFSGTVLVTLRRGGGSVHADSHSTETSGLSGRGASVGLLPAGLSSWAVALGVFGYQRWPGGCFLSVASRCLQ